MRKNKIDFDFIQMIVFFTAAFFCFAGSIFLLIIKGQIGVLLLLFLGVVSLIIFASLNTAL